MFYKIIHKVFQVDKHLIYFCFTLKFNKNLQLVKLLYYFSICTSGNNTDSLDQTLLYGIEKCLYKSSDSNIFILVLKHML